MIHMMIDNLHSKDDASTTQVNLDFKYIQER